MFCHLTESHQITSNLGCTESYCLLKSNAGVRKTRPQDPITDTARVLQLRTLPQLSKLWTLKSLGVKSFNLRCSPKRPKEEGCVCGGRGGRGQHPFISFSPWQITGIFELQKNGVETVNPAADNNTHPTEAKLPKTNTTFWQSTARSPTA